MNGALGVQAETGKLIFSFRLSMMILGSMYIRRLLNIARFAEENCRNNKKG